MTVKYIAQQRITDYGLPFSDTKFDAILATTTEQTLTVPGTAPRFKAVFSYTPGENIWVAVNATATVAGAAFAATDSELNPVCREVRGGDVLHFITPGSGADVSVSFYSLNTTN